MDDKYETITSDAFKDCTETVKSSNPLFAFIKHLRNQLGPRDHQVVYVPSKPIYRNLKSCYKGDWGFIFKD